MGKLSSSGELPEAFVILAAVEGSRFAQDDMSKKSTDCDRALAGGPSSVRFTLYCAGIRPARNCPIFSLRNFSSAGLPPAPAVCPHSDGIGTS